MSEELANFIKIKKKYQACVYIWRFEHAER